MIRKGPNSAGFGIALSAASTHAANSATQVLHPSHGLEAELTGSLSAGGSVYAIKATCKTYRKTATLFLEIYGADTPKL